MPALRPTLFRGSAVRVVYHIARVFSIPSRSARRVALFAGTGLAAYLVTLTATAPASLAVPRSTGAIATGTVWNGEAVLPGGDRLAWHWSPLGSLLQLGFAADWKISGNRSELEGRALLRPGRTQLTQVRGTFSAATLTALADDLPFACDMMMTVDVPRAVIGGPAQQLIGSVRTRRGSCWVKGVTGAATPVPALAFRAEDVGARGTMMWLAPLAGASRDLVVAALSPKGKLDLNVTPEGATALPFTAPPGGVKLEMTL